MRLSTKSRYSLRILLQLASEGDNKTPVKGRLIAKQQEISEPYLEQIMIPLKAAELVKTVRGCHGGYTLGKSPEDITTLDIIELFEGRIEFDSGDSNNKRSFLDECPTTKVWADLSEMLRVEAKKITLASILEQIDVAPWCFNLPRLVGEGNIHIGITVVQFSVANAATAKTFSNITIGGLVPGCGEMHTLRVIRIFFGVIGPQSLIRMYL